MYKMLTEKDEKVDKMSDSEKGQIIQKKSQEKLQNLFLILNGTNFFFTPTLVFYFMKIYLGMIMTPPPSV